MWILLTGIAFLVAVAGVILHNTGLLDLLGRWHPPQEVTEEQAVENARPLSSAIIRRSS